MDNETEDLINKLKSKLDAIDGSFHSDDKFIEIRDELLRNRCHNCWRYRGLDEHCPCTFEI